MWFQRRRRRPCLLQRNPRQLCPPPTPMPSIRCPEVVRYPGIPPFLPVCRRRILSGKNRCSRARPMEPPQSGPRVRRLRRLRSRSLPLRPRPGRCTRPPCRIVNCSPQSPQRHPDVVHHHLRRALPSTAPRLASLKLSKRTRSPAVRAMPPFDRRQPVPTNPTIQLRRQSALKTIWLWGSKDRKSVV